MEYKIQKIVFPTEAKHQICKDLFYRGEYGHLDREKKELYLGKGQKADFATYLNACSYRKWKQYAKVGNAVLYLEIEGNFEICVVGYSKDVASIERTEYEIKCYNFGSRELLRFEFPENNDQMLGFEVVSMDDCVIYGGYYAMVIEEPLNDVKLCIATTTCKKEKFIKKNVELLKNEILNIGDDVSKNLYIHVVDNGRTLTEQEIYGEHIYLHPNSNSGGAGGFARGMIESLNQEPKATHVLLMDDDVLVLPESIIRTYKLLRLIRDEYKDNFISGAMLYYEEPNRQHEDIGTVTGNCMFQSLKPKFDHNFLNSNLDNEADFVKQRNEYAGWWYCCIPTQVIEKNGLPLPIFIRCDDMEYSLRCKANIITMNGICVWHMGFVTKYNIAFDKYQQCRNLLIDKSCSDIMKNVDVVDFVFKSYRIELLRFNYNAAKLVLKAFEDYLKGPKFLKENIGEDIVKENSMLNEELIPLNDIEGIDIADVFSCYFDPPRKFLDKWLFRITYNGQRFWPTTLCKKDYEYIAFDHTYQPQKMAMHDKLVAVNPYAKTAKVRVLDKEKYKELQNQFRRAKFYYYKHKDEIERAYRRAMPYLTSEKFWRKYLDI